MKHNEFQGQPPPDRAVAWCDNKKHRGRISVHIMKKRGCLGKNCKYLLPINNHPFWKERERKLNDKKTRKHIKQIEETVKYGSPEQIAEMIFRILVKEY